MEPSPIKKVAGHIANQLRRPTRMRGRFLLFAFTLTALLSLHVKYNINDIRRTASSLRTYMPNRPTAAFEQDQELEDRRWDDSQDFILRNKSITGVKSTFHLLIPATQPSLSLCKTILSAAILDYPPPTLIGYRQEEDKDWLGADVIRRTLKFLQWDSTHEDDLVLIVDEHTLFQLPAEVLVNRFFLGGLSSTSSFLQSFGRMLGDFNLPSQRPQRYSTNVLFAAQNDCLGSPSLPACNFAPQSPLSNGPRDPYSQQNPKHKWPRYLNSAMLMGNVAHLRPIYKHAHQLMESEMGRKGSQSIFSQIFGAQEYHRQLVYESTLSFLGKVSQWIASKFKYHHLPQYPLDRYRSEFSDSGQSEFGIGLDYSSSLFQITDSSSANDLKHVKISNLSQSLNIPQKLSSKIHTPSDLNFAAPPFVIHPPSKELLAELHTPPQQISWVNIALLANTLVPQSPIIPAIINVNLPSNLGDSFPPLWYKTHARAFLGQSFLPSTNPVASIILPPKQSRSKFESIATLQQIQYVDLRGGRGGVWTDRSEWLDWSEICGAFDMELFDDGKGNFVVEDLDGRNEMKKEGWGAKGRWAGRI